MISRTHIQEVFHFFFSNTGSALVHEPQISLQMLLESALAELSSGGAHPPPTSSARAPSLEDRRRAFSDTVYDKEWCILSSVHHKDRGTPPLPDDMDMADSQRLATVIGQNPSSTGPSLGCDTAKPWRNSEQSASGAMDGNEACVTRRLPTYEKQISIDPHSISYRASGPIEPAIANFAGLSSQSSHLRRALSSTTTMPHSPRSINVLSRHVLRNRLSSSRTESSHGAEILNSDYSSDRSSEFSVAESPISTLDLHRSPLSRMAPPSSSPQYCYDSVYIAPPPPPPRYNTRSRSTGRSLFSAPLPQLLHMGSYKKTMSFQVREVDNFTYGGEERYTVSASDLTDKPASLHFEDVMMKPPSRRSSIDQHAYDHDEQQEEDILEEEEPRSSSVKMSCCTFLPFMGGSKHRHHSLQRKHLPSIQRQLSHITSMQRTPMSSVLPDVLYGDVSDGFLEPGITHGRNSVISHNASSDTAFREDSVMERFGYRNSLSTSNSDEVDDEEGPGEDDDQSHKIERAEEVMLSLNEAYSPVSSAFVFHPTSDTTTSGILRKAGDGEAVRPQARKALKGSNGGNSTRVAFRKVRFNLESADVEQEAESEISSLASNSREMSTMMVSLGPCSLPRSTSRREWDDLLIGNEASHDRRTHGNAGYNHYMRRAESMRHHHQDELFLHIVNNTLSFKESTSKHLYKPMLFRPDTN